MLIIFKIYLVTCKQIACRAEGKNVRRCGRADVNHGFGLTRPASRRRRLSGRYHFDANWTVDLPRSATVATRENPRGGGGKRGRCGAEPRSWINCSRRACKSIADEKKRKITLEDDFSSFPRNHAGPLRGLVIVWGATPAPGKSRTRAAHHPPATQIPNPNSIPKQVLVV